MNNENAFTEEEAINITIQHGYDGSEFITSVWKKRGCLSTNRTLDALLRKLETIYHNVEVKGKGKGRRYILKNKKEEMTEREYNYKGTVPTEEEETMKEYFFNILVKAGFGGTRPYNAWIRLFDLFQRNSIFNEELTEEIKELHMGVLVNPKEIVSEFNKAISNFNKSLIANSFRRLEKEGRITRSISYIFRTIDGNYEEVEEERYEEATNFKKELVESFDIKYTQYIQANLSFGHKSVRMKEIIEVVNKQMEKEFGIKYMYQAIGVSVIDEKVIKEVSKEEFDQAYFKKFINLTQNRQNSKKYQDTKSFWRRTYFMNTLKILSIILKDKSEIAGLEALLRKEMKKKSKEGFLDYVGGYDNDFES
ncbi:hypothetical protein [Halalkalibacter akibai]|uniref:Uncharacterized protein n=1 Tax=Halalkalibacter akibai (strain ATCC 43226 / DSM 21942 / CIP 109018 / JCM 9157 / 1139) TaxID=1236973 RepID=W4QWR2_HALA3|nr:hypothetical protein [Halalkalibacter akibai]GAE35764.1 hypothetical protein JCM9157_2895 [Halalkalibacter akibai JCM 9157]